MRGKKNMQLALVADELKQSAPSAVEAAVGSGNERAAGNDKEATLRAAPGAVQPIQATVAPRTLQPAVAQSSQNKWSMNRQGFVEPQAAGNTALPRHANNTSFDAAFRRVPQAQIRPPSMAPQSSSTGFTPNRFPPAMVMHRSRLSLDTSRPPPLLLPMHRGPPPALDPSRPPPSMLPVNRPRPSLDTSRPPPPLLPWNRPPSQALPAHLLPTPFAPQVVATPRAPSSFVQVASPTGVRPIVRTVPPMPIHLSGDHRSGLLHNQNASLLRELRASDQPQFHCQAPPQLQSSLNRHAVEFYPRSKLINELIAELNVEPRRRKNSITERRKRQRFYRNLKPDVMFESSEFPPELSPMERSNNFPAGRPIILPLGRPNFPNTRSSSVTAAALERSSFDNGFIRNMGYQRNNLPHGQA
ncbi:hypothetical protein KR044_001224 [Drosophila immigrans]|nr:hypothetical protein KR044_001224 [Drosophila immigrans]